MSKEFRKNLSILIVVNLMVKVLGLFYRFSITRILRVEGMTIISLLSPILSLALCLSSFSLPTVVTQNVSQNLNIKSYSNRRIILSAIRITFIFSSIISLLILIFARFLSMNVMQNPMLYFPLLLTIPLIFLSNFSGILKGYLEAHKQFKITSISNLIEQIVKIALSLGILFIFRNSSLIFSISAAMFGMILSEVASFLYLLTKVKKITSLTYKEVVSDCSPLIKQGTPLTVNHLIFSIVGLIEPLLLTFSLGLINISASDSQQFYTLITSFAFPLLTMAFFASSSITKTIFPYISQNKDNPEESVRIIKKSLIFCFLVGVINFNLTFFYARQLLQLLYNDTMAVDIVRILAPFYLINYFSPIFSTALLAIGKEKELLRNNIISHIIQLILMVILSTQASINYNGILISFGVYFIISFLLNFYTLKKYKDIKLGFTTLFSFITITAFNISLTLVLSLFVGNIFNIFITNALTALFIYIGYAYYKNQNSSAINNVVPSLEA